MLRALCVGKTGQTMKFHLTFLLAVLIVWPSVAPATTGDGVIEPLQPQLENLKKNVLALNRDLLILEEELLYPSNTQVVVFMSLDVGAWFTLDAVKLKIDNKLVASELYTERQLGALARGARHRL